MTATLSPVRVATLPKIDVQEVADGLSNAIGSIPALDAANREWIELVGWERWNNDPSVTSPPSDMAWDRFEQEVIAELAPEVAKMLRKAFQERLPWTWEPER